MHETKEMGSNNNNNNKRVKENKDHQWNKLHGHACKRKHGSPKEQPPWGKHAKKTRITKETTSMGKHTKEKKDHQRNNLHRQARAKKTRIIKGTTSMGKHASKLII
jgi:hypothetical protein